MLSNNHYLKVFLKLLLTGSLGCINAHAGIKAYGIFDSGVSIINNGDLNTISLTSGTGTASRLGIRGSEPINDRLSAEFLIETFMTIDDGSNYGLESIYNSATFAGFKYKPNLQLFDTQAELSIRLGRQRNILHDRLYLYDPMRQNLIGSPTGFDMYSMFYNKMLKLIAKLKNDEEILVFRFMFIPGKYEESLKTQYLSINNSHNLIPFGSWGLSFRWDKNPFSIKTGFQSEKKTPLREENNSFLSVVKYSFNQVDFYAGYLRRSPGRQIFLLNQRNIKSECFYVGMGLPLKKILPYFHGNSSVFFSFASPRIKSLEKSPYDDSYTQHYYFASQWGIALKKPLSKKTSIYFFAGEIQNFGKSKFSLEAIPYDIRSAQTGGNPSVIGFSLNQRY